MALLSYKTVLLCVKHFKTFLKRKKDSTESASCWIWNRREEVSSLEEAGSSGWPPLLTCEQVGVMVEG